MVTSFESQIIEEYKSFINENFPKSNITNNHNKLIKEIFNSIEVIDIYTNVFREGNSIDLLEHLKHQLFLIAFNLTQFNSFILSSIIRNISETILRLTLINTENDLEKLLTMSYKELNESIKVSAYYKDPVFISLIGNFFSSYGKESQELHRTRNNSSNIKFLEEMNTAIPINKANQLIKFLGNMDNFILGHFSTQENRNDFTLELPNKIRLKKVITVQKYKHYFSHPSLIS